MTINIRLLLFIARYENLAEYQKGNVFFVRNVSVLFSFLPENVNVLISGESKLMVDYCFFPLAKAL